MTAIKVSRKLPKHNNEKKLVIRTTKYEHAIVRDDGNNDDSMNEYVRRMIRLFPLAIIALRESRRGPNDSKSVRTKEIADYVLANCDFLFDEHGHADATERMNAFNDELKELEAATQNTVAPVPLKVADV